MKSLRKTTSQIKTNSPQSFNLGEIYLSSSGSLERGYLSLVLIQKPLSDRVTIKQHKRNKIIDQGEKKYLGKYLAQKYFRKIEQIIGKGLSDSLDKRGQKPTRNGNISIELKLLRRIQRDIVLKPTFQEVYDLAPEICQSIIINLKKRHCKGD